MSKLIDRLPDLLRVLLGLAFTTLGANFFLHFLPQPPMPEGAQGYVVALVAGNVLLVVKAVEVTTGALLLANRFVPLALTLLAPILVGIVLFHATFHREGIVLPLVLVTLEVALAWAHRDAFAPLLRARSPAPSPLAPAPALSPQHG